MGNMFFLDNRRSDKNNKYMTSEIKKSHLFNQKDSEGILIDSYLYTLKLNDKAVKKISCALEFWRYNEKNFSPFSWIKNVSVPTSSACVERISLITGPIFSSNFIIIAS